MVSKPPIMLVLVVVACFIGLAYSAQIQPGEMLNGDLTCSECKTYLKTFYNSKETIDTYRQVYEYMCRENKKCLAFVDKIFDSIEKSDFEQACRLLDYCPNTMGRSRTHSWGFQ